MRVAVAAGSAIARAGLESLLRAAGIEVVASAPDLASLAATLAETPADAIVAEAPEEIGELPAPLVLLAAEPHPEWAAEALRLGARAILPAEAARAEVVAAVEAAAAGLVTVHPDYLDALLASPRPRLPAETESLTPREIEVLRTLADGMGNKEIAWRLGISEHTVKFHVGSIMAKLGAGSRTEAVTLGIRRGLIML